MQIDNRYPHQWWNLYCTLPRWIQNTHRCDEDSEYLKMKVSALNSSGASLTTKTFEEVPIAKNQVTTYSGSFFGGDPGSGGDTNVSFTITVNTVWDGQIDEAF